MVVFDLDGLLWSPELYQMDMPLRKVPASGGVSSVVVDSYGYELSLYAGARRALAELHFLPRFEGTHVAYASRTHQKKDATRAFEWISVSANEAAEGKDDGGDASTATMAEIASHVQIRSGSKQAHFHALSEASGVRFEDMLFLDNERWNITEVSKLGVLSVYCPNGLTAHEWERALKEWAKRAKRRASAVR